MALADEFSRTVQHESADDEILTSARVLEQKQSRRVGQLASLTDILVVNRNNNNNNNSAESCGWPRRHIATLAAAEI